MPRSRTQTTARVLVAAMLAACAPAGAALAQARSCAYDPTANAFLPRAHGLPPGAGAVPAGVASLASSVAAAVLPIATTTRTVDGTPWDAAPRIAPDGLAPGLTAFLSGPC